VSTELLRLTAYFGERLRGERGFVADELLDLFGAAKVANSVVLRGIGGFGASHQMRTDRSLSTSEDLPVALLAVDTADRIMGLAEPVVAATARGMVTLERARPAGGTALGSGATKLTLYIGRQTRIGGRPAHREVCEVLHRLGFAGAAVFLGVDGTEQGVRRRARFFSANTEVPVMIVAVGGDDQVSAALPRLRELLPAATITAEQIQLCKRDGRLLARPTALPATDAEGVPLWQKLTIHTSEGTRHDGVPIHRGIIDLLRAQRSTAGVTALRGIWGFHGDHRPHGDALFQLGREVPVTTVVVDSPARIAGCFDLIDQLTGVHGLITSEVVPALVSIDGGERSGDLHLAHPPGGQQLR
jgi:PII-like signaling protein